MNIRSMFVSVCMTMVVIGYAAALLFLFGTEERSAPFRILAGIGLVIVLCVLAAGIGLRFAQMYRRRIYEIEEAAILISQGRYQHRIAHFGDKDEIDRLGAEFNQMGEKLEEQVTLLQRLAEENQKLAQEAERAATMEERQRLARELHDSVSQELFALTMLAESAVRLYESGSAKLPATISQIAELANRSQREMRALLLHLRPIELEGRSFEDAASAFLQAVGNRHGLSISWSFVNTNPLPSLIEEQLFRILQEAVANILKHAHTKTARVRLEESGTSFALIIADDGVGMPTDVPACEDGASGDGVTDACGDTYGLRAMKERAQSLGGRLELVALNPGTAVHAVIPKTLGQAAMAKNDTY